MVCEDSDLDARWAGALLPRVVACAVSWPHTQLRLCSLLHPPDPLLPSHWEHHRRGQELPAPFFGISAASEHPQPPAPFPAACPCPSLGIGQTRVGLSALSALAAGGAGPSVYLSRPAL